MEFKFVRTPLMITVGVIWTFIAMFNLFIITMMIAPLNYFLLLPPLVTAIISGTLGFYYLTLSKRNYIVISEDNLLIHKGMMYKNKCIFFNDIESVMESENKIRIQDKNGKETRVLLNMLELKGVKEIRRTLEEKCKNGIMN